MTTVDETVRSAILKYPSLYTNRTTVLHHALCAPHNGYRWVNGEGVFAWHHHRPYWSKSRYLASAYALYSNERDEIRDAFLTASTQWVDEYQAIVDEVESRIHVRIPLVTQPHSIYQQSYETLLMTVPSDVTPDWHDACMEMREQVAADGWVFPTRELARLG